MANILTAETAEGAAAVERFLRDAPISAPWDSVPSEWIRVLCVGDLPVAFAAIAPDRRMDFPRGSVRYAFLIAGRMHPEFGDANAFRELLAACCGDLRAAGVPWLAARLPYALGRELGFETFTHNSAFVLRPEEIEQTFGGGRPDNPEGMLVFDESPDIQEDLLVVARERDLDEGEAVAALREAAWIARSRGKSRILFEYPPAPGPGLNYPIYATRHTPLMVMAMAAGARVRVSPSEPQEDADEEENGRSRNVRCDMVRLTDLAAALQAVLEVSGGPAQRADIKPGAVAFDTDAGQATLEATLAGWHVRAGIAAGLAPVPLRAGAVAQMILGYRSARTLAYLHQVEIPPQAADILEALFPRCWRFSRNETWISRG